MRRGVINAGIDVFGDMELTFRISRNKRCKTLDLAFVGF